MNAIPPDPERENDPAKARAERRLRLLDELAEIGMALARAAGEKALARRANGPGASVEENDSRAAEDDPSLAFTRMARLVQQNLALQTWIEEGPRKHAAGPSHAAPAARVRNTGPGNTPRPAAPRAASGDFMGLAADLEAFLSQMGEDEDRDEEDRDGEDDLADDEIDRWLDGEESQDEPVEPEISRARRERALREKALRERARREAVRDPTPPADRVPPSPNSESPTGKSPTQPGADPSDPAPRVPGTSTGRGPPFIPPY
jgi:hypothetical protein